MAARNRKVSLPKVNLKNFHLPFPINTVSLLVILVIVAAFLIGVLMTKVSYLEKGVVGTTNTGTTDDSGDTAPQVPTGPVDVANGHLPYLGNKDAKVTIVEFSDFQCPFCKALFDDALPSIKKDYVDTGKVAFYYRHYPLTSIHPNAQKAAEAAECANEQGNFWGYHDELFKNQGTWAALSSDQAVDKFADLANSLGLDGASLKSCVDSNKFADVVKKDTDEGTAAGVNGTPATYINGMLISGAAPYSDFKTEIDKQLAAN